jgi:hypothetical protein
MKMKLGDQKHRVGGGGAQGGGYEVAPRIEPVGKA